MRFAVHQLIVAGAVALGGTLGGVVVGNYTTGAPRLSGQAELADYSFSTEEPVALAAMPEPDFASRNGPTHYECQGCDAHLYADPPALYGDASYTGEAAADIAPLPPYQTPSHETPRYETRPYETPSYDAPGYQPQEAPVVVIPAAAPVVRRPVERRARGQRDVTMVSVELPDGVVQVGRPGVVTSNRPAVLQSQPGSVVALQIP